MVLSATPALQAEHARIDLRVIGEGQEVYAAADQEPPAGGRNKPPVLKVHVHKPLVLQFFLTNTYPHAVIEHVKVLYYVVRMDKLGRKAAPSFSEPTEPDKNAQPALETGVVTKGQFVADFKPDCRVGTRLKFQITEPGLYSARRNGRHSERSRTFLGHRPGGRMSADCAQAGHPPTRASFCSSGTCCLTI